MTKSKYCAIKTTIDGITYDSRREAIRGQELKLMERAGVISNLQRQVPFTLIPKSIWGREIKYIADFVYYDNEQKKTVIEDVKGYRTDTYRLKARMMAEMGLPITEIK